MTVWLMLRQAVLFLALEEKPLQINSIRVQHSVTNLGVGSHNVYPIKVCVKIPE